MNTYLVILVHKLLLILSSSEIENEEDYDRNNTNNKVNWKEYQED